MADAITSTELAYFAGFFDGEGSVAIYYKKYVVSLTNTDIRPLKRACEIWGGSLHTQPKHVRPLAVQDLWRWELYGHNSRVFLEDIRPFVMLKAEQIDVYLGILCRVPVGRGTRYSGDAKSVIQQAALKLRMLKRGA